MSDIIPFVVIAFSMLTCIYLAAIPFAILIIGHQNMKKHTIIYDSIIQETQDLIDMLETKNSSYTVTP